MIKKQVSHALKNNRIKNILLSLPSWFIFSLYLIMGLIYASYASAQLPQCRQVFMQHTETTFFMKTKQQRWLYFLKSLQSELAFISSHQRNDEANAHLSQWLAEVNSLWDEMALLLISLNSSRIPESNRSMLVFQLETGLKFFDHLLGAKDPQHTLQLLAKKTERILEEWQEQSKQQGFIGFIPPEGQKKAQNNEEQGLGFIGFIPLQESRSKSDEKIGLGFILQKSTNDLPSTSSQPIGFIHPKDSSSATEDRRLAAKYEPRSIGFTANLDQSGADVAYRLSWGYDTERHFFITIR